MVDLAEGAQSSRQTRSRMRSAVCKVAVSKAPPQKAAPPEPASNDDDDFVTYVTPNKNMRFKISGVKRPKEALPKTTRNECQQPICPQQVYFCQPDMGDTNRNQQIALHLQRKRT